MNCPTDPVVFAIRAVLIAAGCSIGNNAVRALETIAGEDFDGGSTNGGFTASSAVYTPDNSGNTQFRNAFGGSRTDRFGEVSRLDGPGAFPGNEGLPLGLRDDSLPGSPQFFPQDTAGFVAGDKLDDFLLAIDTVNADNPGGDVSAVWKFDIDGWEALQLDIDFGMLGNFEEDDQYSFSYAIDDGPSLDAFNIRGASGVLYAYQMDSGLVVDRVRSGFFSPNDWDLLTTVGELPGDIEFHPMDNGLDGDLVARDGLVPIEFVGGVEMVRAMLDTNLLGTFEETEFEAVADPLTLTSGDGRLVSALIPADFTTFSTALVGSGSTLTLRFDGRSNGADEWFALDNIRVSGSRIPEPSAAALAVMAVCGAAVRRNRGLLRLC